MIIRKTEEEITYKAETRQMVVEVNGKKVGIVDWYKQDNVNSDYDGDIEVDENDRAKLSEDEDEELSDYINEIRDLEIGEEFNTEAKQA